MSVAQYQILRDKLNIRNTAFISFNIKTIAMLIAEMRPHFLAHFTYFSLQCLAVARRRHDSAAHRIKL